MEAYGRSLKNNVFTVIKRNETAGPGHTKRPSVNWTHITRTLDLVHIMQAKHLIYYDSRVVSSVQTTDNPNAQQSQL